MNIYICDAGEMSCYVETIGYDQRYELEWVINLVAAPSRGRARALFVAFNHRELEWLSKISIRKVGEFEIPIGVIDETDMDTCWLYDIANARNLIAYQPDSD